MTITAREAITYREAAYAIASRCGVRTWELRRPEEEDSSDSIVRGAADTSARHIICPEPHDLESLYIWAHECAHVKHRHGDGGALYWQEYQAARFALEELARRGFVVTEELRQGVHNEVADHFNKAMVQARRRNRMLSIRRLSIRRYVAVTDWLRDLKAGAS